MFRGTKAPAYGVKLPHRFTSHLTLLQMATVTKRELVVKISNETGLTQQQVFDVIQKTLDSITDSLSNGDTVVMRNFGAFQVKETKAKIGRNPKDPGKDVPIPARAVVKFKPGKEMKEKVSTTLALIREREAK
ncbi:HU family DNA-binding protein [Haloferula sp.]